MSNAEDFGDGMEIVEIKWLPNAGYTQRGLWRVAYQGQGDALTYRHLAHWRGKDEMEVYLWTMKNWKSYAKT